MRTDMRQGPAEAIVLLHGAGSDATIWKEVEEGLAEAGLPAFALDYPGRNDAPGPARETVEEIASFVLDELARRGPGRVVLVGHSLGGLVSQCLAARDPDRIAGLVLVGTTAKYRDLPELRLSIARDFDGFVATFADLVCGSGAPADVRASVTATLVRAGPTTIIADLCAAGAFDARPLHSAIRAPAVVLSSELDRVAPALVGQRLAAGLREAELRVAAGVGHMIPVEAPGEVLRAIDAIARRGVRADSGVPGP